MAGLPRSNGVQAVETRRELRLTGSGVNPVMGAKALTTAALDFALEDLDTVQEGELVEEMDGAVSSMVGGDLRAQWHRPRGVVKNPRSRSLNSRVRIDALMVCRSV